MRLCDPDKQQNHLDNQVESAIRVYYRYSTVLLIFESDLIVQTLLFTPSLLPTHGQKQC